MQNQQCCDVNYIICIVSGLSNIILLPYGGGGEWIWELGMLIECEQGGGMCPGRTVIYNINNSHTKSIKKATKRIKTHKKWDTTHC